MALNDYSEPTSEPTVAGTETSRPAADGASLLAGDIDRGPSHLRGTLREHALRAAMRKRAEGVPTYSVPEAAVLLSISQEYLYRLIQAGNFPALRMRIGGRQGRYVVPAKAVEDLLDHASESAICVDVAEWSANWQDVAAGGAR